MKLETLGWDNFFEAHFSPHREKGLLPGRIAVQHRDRYTIQSVQGELLGQVSGKFRFDAALLKDFPAVGDWVALETGAGDQPAIIHHVLERKSTFSRKAAGERPDEQIIAANIDIVFLVMGLDGNYNLRRLERYLTVAWDSRAKPVILLNKSDLCSSLEEYLQEVHALSQHTDVLVLCARHPEDLVPVRALLAPGLTGVLLGSSGVGKTTIINCLLNTDELRVQEVRESDSHGRHTTSHRELYVLPTGGIIIDTPGLREIQLLSNDDGLAESFSDIEEIAARCRFRDCTHDAEPGCAVKQAIEEESLEVERYESYLKLQREILFQNSKIDKNLRQEKKEREKKISKQINDIFRTKRKQKR